MLDIMYCRLLYVSGGALSLKTIVLYESQAIHPIITHNLFIPTLSSPMFSIAASLMRLEQSSSEQLRRNRCKLVSCTPNHIT
jgi:hypothetical protein